MPSSFLLSASQCSGRSRSSTRYQQFCTQLLHLLRQRQFCEHRASIHVACSKRSYDAIAVKYICSKGRTFAARLAGGAPAVLRLDVTAASAFLGLWEHLCTRCAGGREGGLATRCSASGEPQACSAVHWSNRTLSLRLQCARRWRPCCMEAFMRFSVKLACGGFMQVSCCGKKPEGCWRCSI